MARRASLSEIVAGKIARYVHRRVGSDDGSGDRQDDQGLRSSLEQAVCVMLVGVPPGHIHGWLFGGAPRVPGCGGLLGNVCAGGRYGCARWSR